MKCARWIAKRPTTRETIRQLPSCDKQITALARGNWHHLLIQSMLLTSVLLGLVTGAQAQSTSYEMLTLDPPLSNVHATLPVSIDELGNVIGIVRNGEFSDGDSTVEIVYRGFYYDRSSGDYELAPSHSIYTAANTFGQIVGGKSGFSGEYSPDETWTIWTNPRGGLTSGVALVWNPDSSEPLQLSPLPGDTISIATGINDIGWVSGISTYVPTQLPVEASAVLWKTDSQSVGEALELPPVEGHLFCVATNIGAPNSKGVCTVVGQSGYSWNGEQVFPVSWKVKQRPNGELKLISGPNLNGPASLLDSEVDAHSGIACNSNGFIVGKVDEQAFRSTHGGNFHLLATLQKGGEAATRGAALGVNEAKDTVGFQWLQSESRLRAVIWPAAKKPVDLNAVTSVPKGWQLTVARDINESGEIAVYLQRKNNNNLVRGVILVPID